MCNTTNILSAILYSYTSSLKNLENMPSPIQSLILTKRVLYFTVYTSICCRYSPGKPLFILQIVILHSWEFTLLLFIWSVTWKFKSLLFLQFLTYQCIRWKYVSLIRKFQTIYLHTFLSKAKRIFLKYLENT